MLFKFQKIVGCIEPWVRNCDTNRIVSLCIVTALVATESTQDQQTIMTAPGTKERQGLKYQTQDTQRGTH